MPSQSVTPGSQIRSAFIVFATHLVMIEEISRSGMFSSETPSLEERSVTL